MDVKAEEGSVSIKNPARKVADRQNRNEQEGRRRKRGVKERKWVSTKSEILEREEEELEQRGCVCVCVCERERERESKEEKQ